jgi:hypothetical protein
VPAVAAVLQLRDRVVEQLLGGVRAAAREQAEAIQRAELVRREASRALTTQDRMLTVTAAMGDPVKAIEDVLRPGPADRALQPQVSEQRYDQGIDGDALQPWFACRTSEPT